MRQGLWLMKRCLSHTKLWRPLSACNLLAVILCLNFFLLGTEHVNRWRRINGSEIVWLSNAKLNLVIVETNFKYYLLITFFFCTSRGQPDFFLIFIINKGRNFLEIQIFKIFLEIIFFISCFNNKCKSASVEW